MSAEKEGVRRRGGGVVDVVKVLLLGLLGAVAGLVLLLALLHALIDQTF